MEFLKPKDYVRSWSTWVLATFATAPVLDHLTGIVTYVVPAPYQPLAVSLLGAVGLVVRAIKQTPSK